VEVISVDEAQPAQAAPVPALCRKTRKTRRPERESGDSTQSSETCAIKLEAVGAGRRGEGYKRGLALRSKGDIDGCIAALEKASRAPKLRSRRVAHRPLVPRSRHEPQALEWLERPRSAAPNVADGHQLLFELADGLEKAGEGARHLRCSSNCRPTPVRIATSISGSIG